jgi:CYTH domain-containing protein
MSTHRHFLVAPSLARLIQKERGGEGVLEGYFPDQPQRSTFVQVEATRGSLILEAVEGGAPDEQASVPLAHAQALLAVSHGQVEYVRTTLSIGSHEIQALHFVRPGALNLVAVTSTSENGQDLPALPWFGPEVSAEPAYQRRRLALDGAPESPEVDVTNAALNSLLDLLEDRVTTWPLPHQDAAPDEPAAHASSRSGRPVPAPESEADEETSDLGFEDAVIRELARALQPRRGG